MDRRHFLAWSAATLVLGAARVSAARTAALWVSCRSDGAGRFFLTAFDDAGQVRLDVPLPARGHGVAVHPSGRECVVFARRPGTFLWVADLLGREVAHRIESPPDRHYYGHGVFDPAGRLLYVTENDFDAGRGVIGVYDATGGYRRLGELPSHGIGPHELRLLGDGKTLVIADGGIRTHPDLGRTKLNLPDMDPCLVYADASDGRLLGAYRPPSEWHQLSIRHLVVTPDDKVLIAMQHQGRADQRPPLVAMHAGEANLRMLTAPPAVQHRMRNYCGSVCTDSGGRRFAVSSPRGNLVTFWSTEGGGFLGSIDVADGCGLAPDTIDGRIVITSGTGDVLRHQVRGGIDRPLELPANLAARWDNHVTLCPAPKARGVDGRSALSGHGRRRDPVVQRG